MVAIHGGAVRRHGTLRGHALKGLGHAGLFPWYVAVLCLLSSLVYLRLPETAYEELEH